MKKIYVVNVELGTHRNTVVTNKFELQFWLNDLSKEFKIITRIHDYENRTTKQFYIENYWGQLQEVARIITEK